MPEMDSPGPDIDFLKKDQVKILFFRGARSFWKSVDEIFLGPKIFEIINIEIINIFDFRFRKMKNQKC